MLWKPCLKCFNDSASTAWIVTELGWKLNEIVSYVFQLHYCIAECEFSAVVTQALQNHISFLVQQKNRQPPFFVHHVHVCGRQIVLGWLEWRNPSFTPIHQHVASRVWVTYLPYTIWSHFSQSRRGRGPLCHRLHRNDAKWTKISIVGWQLPKNCMDYETPFPPNLWAPLSGSQQLTTNVCEALHSHCRNTFTILTPTPTFFSWV